jgi:ABC-type uncharacterized transport system fused permease/ATPase subunit
LRINSDKIAKDEAEIDRLTGLLNPLLEKETLTAFEERKFNQISKDKEAKQELLKEYVKKENILLKQQSEQHQGGMFILKIYPLYKFD